MIQRPATGPDASQPEDQIRARLYAATVKLAATCGYEKLTIEALCERAGVRRRDFYCRFADVEECFLSFHDEIAAQLCEGVKPTLDESSGWHDQIWAAGWAAIRFLREDPARARFLFAETPGIEEEMRTRRERIVRGIAKFLDAGRAELEDPGAISSQTARIVAGAIFDTLTAKVRGGGIERREDFLPELIYMAVLPYLGLSVAEDEFQVQSLHRR